MSLNEIFEDKVFDEFGKGFRKRKKLACYTQKSFSEEVNFNLLKFDTLKKKDSKAKIVATDYGYSVKLSRPHLAFNMCSILAEDNMDLNFTQELMEYDPDEELIRKSAVPLWVVKSKGNNVMIQRIW